jgi:uncharacterized membrane protein
MHSLRPIISFVPFSFSPSATVLLLLLSVRIVVLLSLNVTLGAAFFDNFGFGIGGRLSSLMFVSVGASKQNENK